MKTSAQRAVCLKIFLEISVLDCSGWSDETAEPWLHLLNRKEFERTVCPSQETQCRSVYNVYRNKSGGGRTLMYIKWLSLKCVRSECTSRVWVPELFFCSLCLFAPDKHCTACTDVSCSWQPSVCVGLSNMHEQDSSGGWCFPTFAEPPAGSLHHFVYVPFLLFLLFFFLRSV